MAAPLIYLHLACGTPSWSPQGPWLGQGEAPAIFLKGWMGPQKTAEDAPSPGLINRRLRGWCWWSCRSWQSCRPGSRPARRSHWDGAGPCLLPGLCGECLAQASGCLSRFDRSLPPRLPSCPCLQCMSNKHMDLHHQAGNDFVAIMISTTSESPALPAAVPAKALAQFERCKMQVLSDAVFSWSWVCCQSWHAAQAG